MAENNSSRETRSFVYVGRAIRTDKGKSRFRYCYTELDGKGGVVEDVAAFGAPLGTKKKRGDIIGGLYTGDWDPEEGIAYGPWKYEGTASLEDETILANWQARDIAAEAEMKACSAKKKDASRDPIYESLEPLKEVYRKTNAAGKRAILAKVIEYLTRR